MAAMQNVLLMMLFYLLLVSFIFPNEFVRNVSKELSFRSMERFQDFTTLTGHLQLVYFQANFKRFMCASNCRIRSPIFKYTKRGFICLGLPACVFVMDLPICVDVSRNPGPNDGNARTENQPLETILRLAAITSDYAFDYSRSELIASRRSWSFTSEDTVRCLKELGLFRSRGTRAGRQWRIRQKNKRRNGLIPVIISSSCNIVSSCHGNIYRHQNGVSFRNLSYLKRANENLVVCKSMRFCIWNAQSICNKGAVLPDYLCHEKIDLCAVTESWIKSDQAAVRVGCTPPGYGFIHHPRTGRSGGSIAII